jgi:hypothetical protein
MTDALLSAAALTPDSVVLDLAAGSGDPALTIAERVIRGRVIALDSSRAGCCLLAHTLGGSAWDERSASFRRMHSVRMAKHTVDRRGKRRDYQACVREVIQAVGVSSGTRWMDVLASPGRMLPR